MHAHSHNVRSPGGAAVAFAPPGLRPKRRTSRGAAALHPGLITSAPPGLYKRQNNLVTGECQSTYIISFAINNTWAYCRHRAFVSVPPLRNSIPRFTSVSVAGREYS